MHPEHMASYGKQFEEPSRCELVVLCLRTALGFGTLFVTFQSTSGQWRAQSLFPSPNPNPPNQGRARAPPYPPRCARLGKLLAPAATSYHQKQCKNTVFSKGRSRRITAASGWHNRAHDLQEALESSQAAPKRPPRGQRQALDGHGRAETTLQNIVCPAKKGGSSDLRWHQVGIRGLEIASDGFQEALEGPQASP